MADIGAELDTAAKATKFIGDLATTAVTVGNVVAPIIELLVPWIPGLGPIATDVAIALPYIKQIATYAPAVQQGLINGKPMIEALAGIGEAIFSPLTNLAANHPGIIIAGIVVEDFLKANEFTPQDPRFDRASSGADGS